MLAGPMSQLMAQGRYSLAHNDIHQHPLFPFPQSRIDRRIHQAFDGQQQHVRICEPAHKALPDCPLNAFETSSSCNACS